VSDPRSDEALMLAHRDGDAAAFDLLYGRWRARLYRYLLHQAGAAVADEMHQDVWMKVIAACGRYEVTAKFSTWLFRIAHNRLVDHWRRLGREIVDVAADLADEDPDGEAWDPVAAASAPAEEANPERRAGRAQLARQLVAAIDALPELQREAFLMAEEGGMTLEEIAAATGTGRETVKSRLRYALAKLRSQLGHWR
jgi:RNA polymerase sigma-70 factor (ECF subfamily)